MKESHKPNFGNLFKPLLCILIVAVALTGCAAWLEQLGNFGKNSEEDSTQTSMDTETKTTKENTDKEPVKPSSEGDLMVGIEPVASTNISDEVDPQVLAAVQGYSAEFLFQSLDQKGNLMISPASVFLALAMTQNGAAGTTLEEMIAVLTHSGMTSEDINDFGRTWIQALTTASTERTNISIANSIWFKQEFDVSQTFLQDNADYYGAGARELDFDDKKAVDIINGWVEYHTNGLIEKIVKEIDSNAIMFLINTLYFKSDWATPFAQHDTYERDFYSPDGVVRQDFMHLSDRISFFDFAGGQGVIMPYENRRLNYLAILPAEGSSPRELLAEQAAETFFADLLLAMDQATPDEGYLSIPKYKASYDTSLKEDLIALGMDSAFNELTADFSRLSEDGHKGPYISDVIHKTVIIVDEEGTEAAAVTSVIMEEMAILPPEHELILDRPFIYAIIDQEMGLPLFVGILDDPSLE